MSDIKYRNIECRNIKYKYWTISKVEIYEGIETRQVVLRHLSDTGEGEGGLIFGKDEIDLSF